MSESFVNTVIRVAGERAEELRTGGLPKVVEAAKKRGTDYFHAYAFAETIADYADKMLDNDRAEFVSDIADLVHEIMGWWY